MVSRLFLLGYSKEKALQRLGAAVILHWKEVSPHVQDILVLQALALSNDDADVHAEIERMTGNTSS